MKTGWMEVSLISESDGTCRLGYALFQYDRRADGNYRIHSYYFKDDCRPRPVSSHRMEDGQHIVKGEVSLVTSEAITVVIKDTAGD